MCLHLAQEWLDHDKPHLCKFKTQNKSNNIIVFGSGQGLTAQCCFGNGPGLNSDGLTSPSILKLSSSVSQALSPALNYKSSIMLRQLSFQKKGILSESVQVCIPSLKIEILGTT